MENNIANDIISGINLFALDMDGTVYLGDRWIDGAQRFLEAIENTGRDYVFLTNNSSRDPETYVKKLHRMGLDAGPEKIITSGDATIHLLNSKYPGKKVYLLGNDLLKKQFASAGVILVNEEIEGIYREKGNIRDEIDNGCVEMVVTAFDTTLDYLKMSVVCDLVRAGLPYITTHPDYNCPTETGFIPDSGAIAAFIEASSGRRPEVTVGKPYSGIVDYMLHRTGYKREETAMVGDRLYTDVAAGVNNGLKGILVLSGEATMKDVAESDVKPDLIFDSVRDICDYL